MTLAFAFYRKAVQHNDIGCREALYKLGEFY